ncbi:hypothetical protein HK104_001929 [Borealophlyctis nickersoniae]|nr:hypothetical protein HK104_001929 [Borealophlyctis nickersoniae]
MATLQPQTLDPLDKLKHLHDLRTRSLQLHRTKESLLQTTQRLERQDALLDEISGERRRLERERDGLVAMVKAVVKDIESLSTAERTLRSARTTTSEQLNQLKEEYPPLKDQVDSLRAEHGLPKLPNVQEEIETEMARHVHRGVYK